MATKTKKPYETRGTATDLGATPIDNSSIPLSPENRVLKDMGLPFNNPLAINVNDAVNKANANAAAAEKAKIKEGTVETFTSSETGRASGVTLPDGRTFLGLGPNDVDKIAAGEARKAARPVNSSPVGTAQAAANTQARNEQLVQRAQQGLLTSQELQTIQGANPSIGQALGAGAAGALPGVVGGAATGLLGGLAAGAAGGAIAGTAITPVIGTAIGAVGGALVGFLVAMRNNIKSQQTDQFAADQTALAKGQTMLRSLITDTNQNPQNAPENIALFYQTLNMIDAAHMKTWKDSQENLNKFLGNDGTTQLAKFETFDAAMRQYYINRFETALAMPDPNQILITAEDMANE